MSDVRFGDVASVADVMDAVGVWWAVAGGWSIDLWLGRVTRQHHDIEVVVRRCDQDAVYESLRHDCQLRCIDPPGSGWQPWLGNPLEPPAFQLQARRPGLEFDIFAETIDESGWRYRRDARVSRSVADLTALASGGIAIVRPEVQLLYLAKQLEPKHGHDFAHVRPTLDGAAATWLARALALTCPGHEWIEALVPSP
jgi:hypothetical protein